jgi:hypothetical protein
MSRQGEVVNLLLPQYRPRFHPLLERSALYELLHDIECGRGILPFEEVEDLRNAAVIEQREHLCLPLEQLEMLPIFEVLEVQLFYCDSAFAVQIRA